MWRALPFRGFILPAMLFLSWEAAARLWLSKSFLLRTMHVVRRVDRHSLCAALTMVANRRRLFTKVVLPAALPAIFTGCRVGMGVAWTFVVVAELIAVQAGLGYMIMEARLLVRP